MATSSDIKRLKFDINELRLSEAPNKSPSQSKFQSGKVLSRGFTEYLSENATYSLDNYLRRKKQRHEGFLADNWIPYSTLGAIRAGPADLVKETFEPDAKSQADCSKDQTQAPQEPAAGVAPEQLPTEEVRSKSISNNREGSADSSASREMGSMYAGLSHLRLVLGANERQICAQVFGHIDYWEAREREKTRFCIWENRSSANPSDKPPRRFRYLSPLVQTSTSKDYEYVPRVTPDDAPHDGGPSPDGASAGAIRAGTAGRPETPVVEFAPPTESEKPAPLQLVVGGGGGGVDAAHHVYTGGDRNGSAVGSKQRPGSSSFFVALAANSFKRASSRPSSRKSEKWQEACEEVQLSNLLDKLSCVCRILNALTNLRGRDLRSKNPVSSELLNQMMIKPSEGFLRGDYNSTASTQSKQNPPSLLCSKTNSPVNTSGPVSRPVSNALGKGNGNHSGPTPKSRPSILNISSPLHTPSPTLQPPRSVNFGGHAHKMAAEEDSSLAWEALVHNREPCATSSKSLKNRKSIVNGGNLGPSKHHHHHPAALVSPLRRHNKELPIWQRPMSEDPSLPVAGNVVPTLEERICAWRRAFNEVKNRRSAAFKEQIREFNEEAYEYFTQTLKELRIGPLVDTSLEQMRCRAHENIRKMKIKEDTAPPWYTSLEREAEKVGSSKSNEHLKHFFKTLRQFDHLDQQSIPHLKEKLCLFVMSLPAYHFAQESMVDAICFVLSELVEIPADCLSLWVDARQLPLISRVITTGTVQP